MENNDSLGLKTAALLRIFYSGLKLFGVISIPWLWALSPLIVVFGFWILIILIITMLS
jgi:hypothetical protein